MFNNRPLKASDSRGGREDGARRPTSNGAYGSFWGQKGTNKAKGGHTQALPQFRETGGHTQALPQFRENELSSKKESQPPRSAWGSKDASRMRVDNNLSRKVDLSKSLPHGKSSAVEDGSRGPALPLHHRASPSRAFEQLSSSRGVLPNKDSVDLPQQPQRMHGRPRAIRTELPSAHREPTPTSKSPKESSRRESPQKAGGFQSGNMPLGRAQAARQRHSQHSQMRKNGDSRGPEGGRRTAAQKPASMFGAKSMAGAYPGGMGRAQAKENQDNFFMHEMGDNNDFYVGVVDGHGMQGKQVSGYVGNHLGKKIANSRNSTEVAEIEQNFKSAFKSTADELKRSGIEANESGTTAVTALRRGDNLYVANVGDSRCVLAREGAGGKLQSVEMSDDHKPDREDEKQRILRNRGAVEPIRGFNGRFVGPCRVWTQKQVAGGLAVSRAFGDFSMEKAGVVADPEIRQTKLSSSDKFLVLASDGVWEHMSNQQVVDLAKKHKDPKAASDAIVAEARQQWTTKGCGYIDDITAVVMNLKTD